MRLQSKREEYHNEYVELRNSLKYEIRFMKNERWERQRVELIAKSELGDLF